jgi:putative ABC transport system ATP-binding protein
MSSLTVDRLTVEYGGSDDPVRPLDQLSIDAESGEMVLLLGPSGCGKTTLLSVLSGILAPTSGEVRLGDRIVSNLRGEALTDYRRNTLGIVFQAFNLVPSLSALENVCAPLWAAGVKGKAAKARATELMEAVDMGHRVHHRPGDLSGGQQQRVAIARALVHDPPLLLADEPTAHLDHVQVEGVLRILRGLASPGRLVVVATHDDRMTPLADRVVQMRPELATVSDVPVTRRFAAGKVIFREGDESDLVYVVRTGEVVITRDGRELTRLGKGDYFGELGPMLGFPRSATATAARATTLEGCSVRDFRERILTKQERQPTRRKASLKTGS